MPIEEGLLLVGYLHRTVISSPVTAFYYNIKKVNATLGEGDLKNKENQTFIFLWVGFAVILKIPFLLVCFGQFLFLLVNTYKGMWLSLNDNLNRTLLRSIFCKIIIKTMQIKNRHSSFQLHSIRLHLLFRKISWIILFASYQSRTTAISVGAANILIVFSLGLPDRLTGSWRAHIWKGGRQPAFPQTRRQDKGD